MLALSYSYTLLRQILPLKRSSSASALNSRVHRIESDEQRGATWTRDSKDARSSNREGPKLLFEFRRDGWKEGGRGWKREGGGSRMGREGEAKAVLITA